jgi:hypothetical protein
MSRRKPPPPNIFIPRPPAILILPPPASSIPNRAPDLNAKPETSLKSSTTIFEDIEISLTPSGTEIQDLPVVHQSFLRSPMPANLTQQIDERKDEPYKAHGEAAGGKGLLRTPPFALKKRKSDDLLTGETKMRAQDVAKDAHEYMEVREMLLNIRRPKNNWEQKSCKMRRQLLLFCCHCKADREVENTEPGGVCRSCTHHRCLDCTVGSGLSRPIIY